MCVYIYGVSRAFQRLKIIHQYYASAADCLLSARILSACRAFSRSHNFLSQCSKIRHISSKQSNISKYVQARIFETEIQLPAEDAFSGPKSHRKQQYYAIPALVITTPLIIFHCVRVNCGNKIGDVLKMRTQERKRKRKPTSWPILDSVLCLQVISSQLQCVDDNVLICSSWKDLLKT